MAAGMLSVAMMLGDATILAYWETSEAVTAASNWRLREASKPALKDTPAVAEPAWPRNWDTRFEVLLAFCCR